MSGGGKTTTTTGSNEPWAKAQPALEMGLGDAQNLYKSGIGSQPYTGSTVVPFANQSVQGFNSIQNIANAGMQPNGGMQLQGNPGWTPGGGSPHSMPNDAAYGGGPPVSRLGGEPSIGQRNGPNLMTEKKPTPTQGNPYGYMGGTMNQLQQYASGQNLDGRNNPAFNQVLNRMQDDAVERVDMGAAAAGRYGSGVHQGNVAREVGNVTANMLSNRHDQEVGNMFNAQQALPGAFQSSLAPAQALGGVGQAYEDLFARQKNDELRIFDATQNAPWNQLGRLNAIATGAGSMGGTQTQVQRAPSNGFGGAFGNALAGYGYGGWPGAALGGLSGLFR